MNKWQMIYLFLNLTGLGMYLAKNGQPREGKYNFFGALTLVIFEVFVLTKGGFF